MSPRQSPARPVSSFHPDRDAAHGRPMRSPRLKPVTAAVVVLLLAGGAHAQRAFSPAWMAQKNVTQNSAAATGRLPNGQPVSMLNNPLAQQQQANAQLARSIDNLNLAARGIAAQQAAQAAARAAALAAGGGVPDGLAEGGLKVDTNSLTAGWLNANGPVQTTADGKTNVAIQQTADKAILNWESFNVGKNTTVDFKQQADWAVLNRVNDPNARPSQIQGRIKGDGTVLIANRNGIVFSGTSQVDTRNLVAAAAHLDDAGFKANGIYAPGNTPNFKDALGQVEVQAGARITTPAPKTATQGGGYVLLMGSEVRNAGAISTPGGQALLAAGDGFTIRKGVGTDGNQASTTRGNEATVTLNAGSTAGKVVNAGLIAATTGDVTLAGREVHQDGVVLSSTTVNTRGTVHLNALGADGRIVLGQGAVTAAVIDSDDKMALDSQRDGLRSPAVSGAENIVALVDRRDQSRIEITSGGSVDFQGESLTLATGGQIAVNATVRSLVRERALLDVSGAVGVNVTMASNNVKVNIQGNEQRDAPVNRDGKSLNSNDVWIDRRSLVFVPKGTNGYESDRWYTAGGLLEVGGYLATQGHTVGEWMAQGGVVNFGGGDVVTQAGSTINLSGGTIDVQTGFIHQSWLKGADGRLYEVSKAPGDLLYTGLYKGFEEEHARWGKKATAYFYSPLIAPQRRLEGGYTVGRDAGLLVVGTKSAVIEGDIAGHTFQGSRQTQSAQAGLDGYDQSQKAVARGAQLAVGSYIPYHVKDSGTLQYRLTGDANTVRNVVLGHTAEKIAAGLDLRTALSPERQGTLFLDTDRLNAFGLGGVKIAAVHSIIVESDLTVGHAGEITLYGPKIDVNADLTVHGGTIRLGNVLTQVGASARIEDTTLAAPARTTAGVTLAEGATLDASGLWSNQRLDASDGSRLPYLNGGTVALRSSGDVTLAAGSRVDVSSGAALDAKGRLTGGKGGDLTLAANAFVADNRGSLVLDGELRGHGVNGGGRLSLQAGKVLISDAVVAPQPGTLQLDSGFFDKGFAAYDITGNEGLRVADGTQVTVTAPVYRLSEGAQGVGVASGADPRSALEIWTPPPYQENPGKGLLTARKGASLSLQVGALMSTAAQMASAQAHIGQGAQISVDPGQSISVRSIGQLTVDGTLNAWGGSITLGGVSVQPTVAEGVEAQGHGRSIWVGEHAVLDVAARASTAVDSLGRRYGTVNQGGSIVIGGAIDPATGIATAANLFVVVREGARLDASGTQAVLDLPGAGAGVIASRGGSISLASNNGVYLDGALKASSGGAGAAGGTLNVALETPLYVEAATAGVRQAREVIVSAADPGTPLPVGSTAASAAGSLAYGHGRLTAAQVDAGGFDNLSLLSNGLISFDGDVSLRLGQSLNLYSGALALADGADRLSRVLLAAPSVRLAGVGNANAGTDSLVRPTVQGGVSTQGAAGVLRVEAANVLDVRDGVNLGAHAERSKALAGTVDRRAFDQAELSSQGDMRFLAGTTSQGKTVLTTQADLNLTAAQIYPATGAVAQVTAGFTGGDFDPARTLRIGRVGSAAPAQPYSVFGSLSLSASTIEQGGVLRAPMGKLTLGVNEGVTRSTKVIDLLPGSLTSVSAEGLVLPYGGTVDGVTWQYDGKQVQLLGVGGTSDSSNLVVGLQLSGRALNVQRDAVLDLSGGGELFGAAFVSGRGGSTDARYNPLLQIGADGRFSLPGLATNPVYAIVPGVQPGVAPSGGEAGATQPLVGQQIRIGAGVPGLPAGTYTLLPSTYALLPGAFRVEVNGRAPALVAAAATPRVSAMNNGSWSTDGVLSIAHTGLRDSLASQVIVTPAEVLRRYAQYNETRYADFVRADAARLGVPRAALEADAKTLGLELIAGRQGLGFIFDGKGRFKPAAGGFGAAVQVGSGAGGDIEIISDTAQASGVTSMVSVRASALNALGAARLVVGGQMSVRYGQGGNFVGFDTGNTAASVTLRQGATLAAPEVFLMTGRSADAIEIEQGASINTLGRGQAAYDSKDGFIYRPGDRSVLAVSNGRLQMLAPVSGNGFIGPGSILIGACKPAACGAETSLYSEGSIAFATTNRFVLDDSVRYGTRHLALAVGGINVGSAESLADAAARGVLPSGLTLNQQVMDRLLRGDTSTGAPALQSLALTAGQSLNFHGTTTLSTLDSAGRSLLDELLLTTPAIYGHGHAGDLALIQTGTLVWGGATSAPPAVVGNGAGTGSGTLELQARRIEFGQGPDAQPDGLTDNGRMTLGFANVHLNASERITANHKGSLAVHQSQGAYEAGKGFAYSGGNLTLRTPLLTGEAGSVNRISAGGALTVVAPASGAAAVDAAAIDALGAELLLAGRSVRIDTSVVLPSGKLTVSADEALILGAASRLDLAGRKVQINDVGKYSWGGDVTLESRHGNIRQAAGSLIDLSAQHNQGGLLKAVAVDAGAGWVDLQGQVRAGGSGHYDAGGTLVPYKAGGVDIRAQQLGDFAALNQRLNQGLVFGSRSFQIKQGSLVIGDELKSNQVNVSVDNGSLTVVGTIDASGERVGTIRLAGQHGLTLAGSAVLDAHGTALRVDSYGKIIDAPNRAVVELNSGEGRLTLAEGTRIDLRHGTAAAPGSGPGQYDGLARGTLELNAPRLNGNDVDIDARGPVDVRGARSIALNAVARYTDAPIGTEPSANGRPYQVIDQHYLDQKHALSEVFIDNALRNDGLMNGKLAGLNNGGYRDAFRLRPGVEIVTEGDLVVSGDLDLSGMRYASVNPHTPKTAVYGSGEVGSLVVRAGGNLDIYGSINDGFAPPPPTPDDNGWVLTPGLQGFGGDVIVPGPGVVLADGSAFPVGKTLNYALPIKATTLAQGTVLPTQGVLDAALTLPANTVLSAAVRDSAGTVLYAAGTLLKAPVLLAAGTRLDAGTVLTGAASLRAMTWPAGVPLPSRGPVTGSAADGVLLAGNLALRVGALIPYGTDLKLPDGALSVPLRTVTGALQRQNWAVAPMLAEGSQSWSLRLVSGADIQAADTRSIKPAFAGDLTLADTHYGIYETHDKKIIPGKPAQPGGAWYWDELAAELYGVEAGTPVPADFLDMCGEPGNCVLVKYVWNEDAAILGYTPGQPVLPNEESFCDDGFCVSQGEPTPAVPEQVIVGAVKRVSPVSQHFSVLRTGTGDLDLIASGNVSMQSPYGIYTAGTSSAARAGAAAADFNRARATAADGTVLGSAAKAHEALVDAGGASPYAAWYPDGGGNLLLRTGGSLTGDVWTPNAEAIMPNDGRTQINSANLGNWLWRQGTGDTAGVTPVPTSWWINFGTYVKGTSGGNSQFEDSQQIDLLPRLVGFTGVGTLGGGNLTLDLGGDGGMQVRRGHPDGLRAPRSEGLVLAVGSTGRVVDGRLLLTGGGDLDVRMGGDLNPGLDARATRVNTAATLSASYNQQTLNLNGVLTNLRGALTLQAGSLGGIALNYGSRMGDHDTKESRAYSPYTASLGTATGGITLMLGDATASLSTRGDLVLAGTGDPGRISTENTQAFSYNGSSYGAGFSWFSLWTERTAIDMFSAGGSLTPSQQTGSLGRNGSGTPLQGLNYSSSDGRFIFPAKLGVVAANGSIYLGPSALGSGPGPYNPTYSLLLAPSSQGRLAMLAGDSIYASGYAVDQSGESPASMPKPFAPAFMGELGGRNDPITNSGSDAVRASTQQGYTLFAFRSPTDPVRAAAQAEPARFYAQQGDIVGLRSGEILTFAGARQGQVRYEAAGPVWMRAGRDIVSSGTALGLPTFFPTLSGYNGDYGGDSRGNLFVHNSPTDVSVVSAGRDILYSAFLVAGPGTLEISAGRNILMEGKAAVVSLGPVVAGDLRPGASVVMQAGVGSGGLDELRFVTPYLDPANLAQSGVPLADQGGKVVKTYEAELVAWLAERYGFSGDGAAARRYYQALPSAQQRVFARSVYFAELQAGGREYNDADSPRYGSYLRGRNAIAALFPAQDAQGREVRYQGDITLYGGAGVNTLFGGDITLLTPGGRQVLGIEGKTPQPVAGVVPGVITQGAGDIHVYALGSILLGQSRIMTTFGGGILGWSAEGDINAGRGSKTTVVYTPPKRVYDSWGNVTLSSDVPSTGAGIATLAPIAEVPAGDIDLIAPLGTIDAGEAGIRVSGNVNLAALQVVNAANIQVKGQSVGIPTVAAVNVGALSNASAAASQAAGAAQEVLQRERLASRQALPSVFTVRVLGFGNEAVEGGGARPSDASPASPVGYRPGSAVQVLGQAGRVDEGARNQLTPAERQTLGL